MSKSLWDREHNFAAVHGGRPSLSGKGLVLFMAGPPLRSLEVSHLRFLCRQLSPLSRAQSQGHKSGISQWAVQLMTEKVLEADL